jgi:ureidoglycolate lyase
LTNPSTDPRILPLRPLTAEAFAPFGQLLSAGIGRAATVNEGRGIRFDGVGRAESRDDTVTPVLAVYRIEASTLPFTVREMEQHPRSSQAFVPMTSGRYLVVVAPTDADGEPDPDGAVAFEAVPGQAINYAPGVWHCPLVALNEPGDFVMFMWQDADPTIDCRIVTLAAPLTVPVPSLSAEPSSSKELLP